MLNAGWIARTVERCDRRRWTIIILWSLILVLGLVVASGLQLKTSFAELLPDDDPGVVALTKTQKRMGDISLLLIGINSPEREANLKYAAFLTDQLNHLPKTVCDLAAYNVHDLRDFFSRNRWLYLSENELQEVHDSIRKEVSRRKNPLFVSLDDDGPEDLKRRIANRDRLGGRFEDGYFVRKGHTTVWIAALPPGGLFVENAGEALFNEATRLIHDNPPETFHPRMRAHVGGPVATALDNRAAVERDILWVTITCVVLIGLSIGLYFRHLRAVPLVAIPPIIGMVLAFAVARLAFGYLNSSTAFLGSIIVGNGINYGIILTARYEEECAGNRTMKEGLIRAIAGVWRGTLLSSIVASAAYASLVVTSFRGFYQFGIMGASGCLFSWLVTFTLVPAMLLVLDRRAVRVQGRSGPVRLALLSRWVERRARLLLAGSMALVVLGVVGCTFLLDDPFEYDFRKLNSRVSKTDEALSFDRNLDALFGRWPSPTLVLADRIEDVEPIRNAIRRQDTAAPGNDVIGQIVTVYDLLPGTTEVQKRKLETIAKIRKLSQDPALVALDEKDRRSLDEATPPDNLRVLLPRDLPPLARRPFTEVDGTVGKVVLIYPVEQGLSVWNGRDLLRIASVIQHIKLDNGTTVDTAGSAVVFGAMIRSVLRDGPIATLASFLAVMLLIALVLRPWRWAVLSAGFLIIGVVWMVGAAGWMDVRITFLNFIALPITFGIGVEYAVNVTARYREHMDIHDAISSTGGAVAMCSWTTIVGYGSLLAAQNHALQGFGAMAILGEIACLSAAIVTLPALLVARRNRARAS